MYKIFTVPGLGIFDVICFFNFKTMKYLTEYIYILAYFEICIR